MICTYLIDNRVYQPKSITRNFQIWTEFLSTSPHVYFLQYVCIFRSSQYLATNSIEAEKGIKLTAQKPADILHSYFYIITNSSYEQKHLHNMSYS